MKDIKKLSVILLFGLLTAVIIYPFLHELGHCGATILLGGKILEFNILPLPNILCSMANTDNIGMVFIGLNGMIFPIAVSSVISLKINKNFLALYFAFVLNFISLFAVLISFFAVILFCIGKPIINEDVTLILEAYPGSLSFIIIFLTAITAYLTVMIKHLRPIEKCLEYFDL